MLRFTWRFLFPIALILAVMAWLSMGLVERAAMAWFDRNLLSDSQSVADLTRDLRLYVLCGYFVIGIIVSLVGIWVAQVSWQGWMQGLRTLLRPDRLFRTSSRQTAAEFRPVLKEIRTLLRDLDVGAMAKDEAAISWNPNSLRAMLKNTLKGEEVIVVSNREPYMHVKKANAIEVHFPASGLVSAVEPIMRACSGTWVAHGGGNADFDVVDKNGIVAVPPEKPAYRLKRVRLTEEEEEGYYYGFSNEGLWPLCHIAHVRPIFRQNDWEAYGRVNQKFADAIVETVRTKDPLILVQDYHFALLPKMLRERLPDATIISFWHIPWPNPEAFGICPWREEILEGMLGSTILGFHTRIHCNNFLDTVDRFLESRIDREQSNISYVGKMTAVRQYPISIEWPPQWLADSPSVRDCRAQIFARHGLSQNTIVGVGVDRMDYTKGILERFAAIERCFEKYPQLIGHLCFIQLAAPSRTKISRYRYFSLEVDEACRRINRKYGRPGYLPIILRIEHHEPQEVYRYYRAANFCFVSSLHDGMNLVAKEFVAARDDESGVLILSMFAGASHELPEAFIVNPYNADQCADAIFAATEMSPGEQFERMRAMRGYIREFNVFRWAGRMLTDAVRIRSRHRLQERTHSWEFQQKSGVGL